MKKENNTNVSFNTYNRRLFKNPSLFIFCDDAIPLHNFEFRKKKVLSLTKDFFFQNYQL